MSRILRRPMFRGGGPVNSYGTGIAAPLVPGYQGGGSINTPRRGLVSLPGGYAGEEMSLMERISAMFGNANVGTSSGIIPNPKKFTTSAATTDGSTTGGEIVEANVKPIVGKFEPKNREESDDYQDFKINQPDILSVEEINEKVEAGKSDVSNQPWWMLGLPPMMDGAGAGNYMKNLEYDKSDAGKKEYKDELTEMNEENKRLYEKYKIPYEGDVSGNKVPPSLRGDGRDEDLEKKILTDYYANKEDETNEPEVSPEISAKDAIAQNQALFAELLGADKARGQDIGDMLLRFSGAGGNTVGEKFQNYTRAESAAGPSRSEKIKQTAAGLAINDYVAGKRSVEQINKLKEVENFRSKLKTDQFTIQEGDSWREGLDKTVLKYGGKEGKANDVGIIAETIKYFEPGLTVFREDNVNPKKLKIGDLEIGITIITLKNGSKKIIKKTGEGENDFVDLTSKYPV